MRDAGHTNSKPLPPDRKPHARNRRVMLDTDSHKAGCEATTRIWSKHRSEVLQGAKYHSTILRTPVGQCHLCLVDCSAPMEVDAEGNPTKASVYLPLEGSMEIRAGGKTLRAVPGGPMFLPSKTGIQFRATPIRCIVLEVPEKKLRAELTACNHIDPKLEPFALDSSASDAQSLTGLLNFAIGETDRQKDAPQSDIHARRLEAHLISVLARGISTRLSTGREVENKIGCLTVQQIEDWLAKRLRAPFEPLKLAKAARTTPRSLQKGFLKYFHSSPLTCIRDMRLEASHAVLSGSDAPATIAEVAERFQFQHLGRFAAAYRKKFGESPSETLRNRSPASRSKSKR